ncbi:MAG: hypothetical protein M1818_008003 [Claussenomyces sp. TS43310]|nr:MAG: hypothetical protein M1818_008003 [Claussenomyces sp. TS43310]
MSYGAYSDEVAEDYRKALEDLTMNSRYEISNLTVIAKENTEHALAISDALKNHIKTTAPVKKLPAFYVLDSVVKNVGTPYTLFFGRNLYSTFMEAYALVDNNVRRKMEEMLRTWKEPVPGSIDTRPVFPIEVTRPIETALIRARTSAIQAQQEQARLMQPLNRSRPGVASTPYRNTPTPPNAMRAAQYPPPGYAAGQERGFPGPHKEHDYRNIAAPQQPQLSQYLPPASAVPTWQQQQSLPPQATMAPEISIGTLTSDIANLITVSKSDFAQNPYDSTIQTRLKALLDLQSILENHRLPPDQLAAIRDQVAKLSLSAKPQPPPTPVPSLVPVVQQPLPQQPNLSNLLGQGGLAALLARSSAGTPQTQTPPPQPAIPIRSPQLPVAQPSYCSLSPPTPAPAAAPNPVSLLEQLRAAGLLPSAPSATNTPPVPPVTNPNTLSSVASQPTPFLGGVSVPSTVRSAFEIPNDVELKPASLKIPRPHLISLLYDRLGVPCTQCGRRFKSDEEGRMKKKAHMDWHFRVNLRMSDAEKRGQHRSWYVDELDWIKSRETEDDHLASASNGSAAIEGVSAVGATSGPRQQYIVIPENPPNTLCPICQEKFEAKYLDDAQEWVWMDAVNIGGRIYHATCHAETPAYRRGTPDTESILGKRKNEDDHISLRTKIKTEPLSS